MNRTPVTPLAPAAAALLLGLATGGLSALAGAAAPQGGIEPTEFRAVQVAPGPEPGVTFFATGEAIGKIEPCG
jgi:hypothetical protein